jgi:Fe-S-cluster containining protein
MRNKLKERILTDALCQALIIKKEVSADRFDIPALKNDPVQCPVDCHACCKVGVTLDLTVAEALMIYLLNRDVVDLIEEYTRLHKETGYCPFMIMDKCIINTYKPTACQMYMPFEYKGKAMCFYLANDEAIQPDDQAPQNHMNSRSYDIHGFMMTIQRAIDRYFPHSFFKNIYEGTLWWKTNYQFLPENTRTCLESILNEEYIGLQLMKNFAFEETLSAGLNTYTEMVANHSTQHGKTGS